MEIYLLRILFLVANNIENKEANSSEKLDPWFILNKNITPT